MPRPHTQYPAHMPHASPQSHDNLGPAPVPINWLQSPPSSSPTTCPSHSPCLGPCPMPRFIHSPCFQAMSLCSQASPTCPAQPLHYLGPAPVPINWLKPPQSPLPQHALPISPVPRPCYMFPMPHPRPYTMPHATPQSILPCLTPHPNLPCHAPRAAFTSMSTHVW